MILINFAYMISFNIPIILSERNSSQPQTVNTKRQHKKKKKYTKFIHASRLIMFRCCFFFFGLVCSQLINKAVQFSVCMEKINYALTQLAAVYIHAFHYHHFNYFIIEIILLLLFNGCLL